MDVNILRMGDAYELGQIGLTVDCSAKCPMTGSRRAVATSELSSRRKAESSRANALKRSAKARILCSSRGWVSTSLSARSTSWLPAARLQTSPTSLCMPAHAAFPISPPSASMARVARSAAAVRAAGSVATGTPAYQTMPPIIIDRTPWILGTDRTYRTYGSRSLRAKATQSREGLQGWVGGHGRPCAFCGSTRSARAPQRSAPGRRASAVHFDSLRCNAVSSGCGWIGQFG